MKVTLQYGSALSPLCFIIIIDILAEEAGTKPAWVILFKDDSVLVSGTVEEVEEVEEELDIWSVVIDRLITKDFELADRKQSSWCHLGNGV